MKKFYLTVVIAVMAIFMVSCTSSYTTVTVPRTQGTMLVTTGDMPNKNYEVLGLVESAAMSIGFGLPTESKLSEMKTEALNDGLVRKAEQLGADAVINVDMWSTSYATWIFFLQTNMFAKGTAIRYK